MLIESAVAPEVAAARGYRSVTSKAELCGLSFSKKQARSGLLIPIFGVTGAVVTHQLRPDAPRIVRGKPLKYETPRGSRMAVDVPPGVHEQIGDPTIPLIITEGSKKADAAVSRGLCCIALLGVWNWRGRNGRGGKVALPDWESVALDERDVYIAFDSDVMEKGAVANALERLTAFLKSRGAQVRLIYLPSGTHGAKVGLDDYFVAGHRVEELFALASTDLRRPTSATTAKSSSLPTIVATDRQLRDITDDALRALALANEPVSVFVRGGQLVRVRTDENSHPLIEVLTEAQTRSRLARVADFVSGKKSISPPLDVVRDLLALGVWGFPALEAITETPALRSDGTILSTAGYDPTTRLIYKPPPGFVMPPVSMEPTAAEIDAARTFVLDEMLGDFPFVGTADRANYLGLLLTPIIRPAISGHAPLALLDKPGPGTGASLLAEIVATIGTGKSASMMTAPESEEEWRKKLTAVLMTGATIVILDNVTDTLSSAILSAVLTAAVWEDRILGRSATARLPQRATWIATGNNLRLAGDTARRSYWVRLDARTSRPWQRTHFRKPQLLAWVRAHRDSVLAALLTLVRAWYASGCPPVEVPRIGGFEPWASIIGSVLAVAGISGFLTNLDALYDQVDDEAGAWEALLTAWFEMYGEQPVTVSVLTADVQRESSTLRDALPSTLADVLQIKNFGQRLGTALAGRADRIYGDFRLERATSDSHAKVGRWRVRGVRGAAGTVSTPAHERSLRAGEIPEYTDANGPNTSPQVPAVPAYASAAHAAGDDDVCHVYEGEL